MWSKCALFFRLIFAVFHTFDFKFEMKREGQGVEHKNIWDQQFYGDTFVWFFSVFVFETKSQHRWNKHAETYRTTAIARKRNVKALDLFYCRQFLIRCSFEIKGHQNIRNNWKHMSFSIESQPEALDRTYTIKNHTIESITIKIIT